MEDYLKIPGFMTIGVHENNIFLHVPTGLMQNSERLEYLVNFNRMNDEFQLFLSGRAIKHDRLGLTYSEVFNNRFVRAIGILCKKLKICDGTTHDFSKIKHQSTVPVYKENQTYTAFCHGETE